MTRAPWRDFGAPTTSLTIARRTRSRGVLASRSRSHQRSAIASEILREIAQRVGAQQPAVFLARLLADRVASTAGIPDDPGERVGVQCRSTPLFPCFGVACQLDRTGLGERRGELLALAPPRRYTAT